MLRYLERSLFTWSEIFLLVLLNQDVIVDKSYVLVIANVLLSLYYFHSINCVTKLVKLLNFKPIYVCQKIIIPFVYITISQCHISSIYTNCYTNDYSNFKILFTSMFKNNFKLLHVVCHIMLAVCVHLRTLYTFIQFIYTFFKFTFHVKNNSKLYFRNKMIKALFMNSHYRRAVFQIFNNTLVYIIFLYCTIYFIEVFHRLRCMASVPYAVRSFFTMCICRMFVVCDGG